MTETTRILIVEDEPLIAMMLQDFLEVLGYDVAGVADSSASAAEMLGAGNVHLAILDVHLRGGETCWPIADRLVEAKLPFLLATGGITDAIPDPHREAPVLAKPFTLDSVEKALGAISRTNV